jgi:indolepyruvate ferredoxin oxidoreductase
VEPVDTEFGRKTRIDQTSCNKDFSCLLGDCPSFMTVIPGSAKAKVAMPALSGDLAEPAHKPGQANVVLVGVGGTGVVTANQVLANAALLDGMDARAMDQTGLSQKAGAVVSHLRIGPEHRERPGLVGLGAADTYLAFDALAATSASNLDRCAPDRTVAVVSTSQTPTGETVTDPSKILPASSTLLGTIADRTIGGRMVTVDALGLAAKLFGSTTAANFLVIGAAYQSGLLPMSAASIEAAIEQNGVGVATTIQAFRAGRRLVLDPTWPSTEDTAKDELLRAEPFLAAAREILAEAGIDSATALTRTADLIGYQDTRYARRYVDVLTGVESEAVREVVARQLYKLMAYKDEYEVARLHLDPAVRQQFGPDAKVRVMLHPPLLRALGMRRKLALGRTAGPAFRVLRSMRRLRGHWLDLFGHTALRRLERDLITEYVAVVEQLNTAPPELALRIAALPDLVRGYEEIKVESVRKYRAELTDLVAELGKQAQPVR